MNTSITVLRPTFDAVPADLQEYRQWVGWRAQLKADGKLNKIPCSPHSGITGDAHDPRNWSSYIEAIVAYIGFQLDGIGFVLTERDPFAGVDLDHCLDASGVVAPWAARIVALLDSYTEVTPSGTGLRVLVRGTLPPGGRKRGDIEMYDRRRFLTVTGHVWKGPEA